MPSASRAFLPTLVAVVLATLLSVMSVAFVSVPMALGGHPGEPFGTAGKPAFHPT